MELLLLNISQATAVEDPAHSLKIKPYVGFYYSLTSLCSYVSRLSTQFVPVALCKPIQKDMMTSSLLFRGGELYPEPQRTLHYSCFHTERCCLWANST